MIQVVDDFFPDPFLVRNTALKCDNFSCLSQYPGKRCKVPLKTQDLTLNLIEKYIKQKFKISKKDPEGMSFNFIDSSYCCGMTHSDHPVATYSCIIFLSPQPQKTSGIEIYQKYEGKNINPIIVESNKVKEYFFSSSRNIIEKIKYKNISHKIRKKQKNKIVIENKFNRMVFFDSDMLHNAQNYFGNTKESSRLTLMTFLHQM